MMSREMLTRIVDNWFTVLSVRFAEDKIRLNPVRSATFSNNMTGLSA